MSSRRRRLSPTPPAALRSSIGLPTHRSGLQGRWSVSGSSRQAAARYTDRLPVSLVRSGRHYRVSRPPTEEGAAAKVGTDEPLPPGAADNRRAQKNLRLGAMATLAALRDWSRPMVCGPGGAAPRLEPGCRRRGTRDRNQPPKSTTSWKRAPIRRVSFSARTCRRFAGRVIHG